METKDPITPDFDAITAARSVADALAAHSDAGDRDRKVAPEAIGLLNSSLILNLNEPNVLGDVSWVESGRYVGIWWSLHLGLETWGSGERHGATTANARRYIDRIEALIRVPVDLISIGPGRDETICRKAPFPKPKSG